MDSLLEKLSELTELKTDEHDGSYELVREVVKALKNININTTGIEDLDMLYFMTVGTWSYSYEKKKERIEESHLRLEDKQRLIQLIDKLEENAENRLYENKIMMSLLLEYGHLIPIELLIQKLKMDKNF